MIENARRTAVRTIWAPLILHDLLMSGRAPRRCSDVWGCTRRSGFCPQQPPTHSAHLHASSGHAAVTLSVSPHRLHVFYFLTPPLKITRVQLHVFSPHHLLSLSFGVDLCLFLSLISLLYFCLILSQHYHLFLLSSRTHRHK